MSLLSYADRDNNLRRGEDRRARKYETEGRRHSKVSGDFKTRIFVSRSPCQLLAK